MRKSEACSHDNDDDDHVDVDVESLPLNNNNNNNNNSKSSVVVVVEEIVNKRLKVESCFGILGGFIIVTFVFIASFFCVDYSSLLHSLRSPLPLTTPLHLLSSPSSSSSSSSSSCDVFDGNWVWDDEAYPLYHSQNCSFLDDGFRCSHNGRPDTFYTNWRWQPNHCDLPRFNARKMLEKLRDKRLVFVGDSIGRNQWESLLCMLSSSITNKSTIYEVNGRPITKHTGYLVFKFEDFNCTIEYYRSPFLVVQGRPPPGAPRDVKMTLRVDRMDWISHRWRDADVLVLNAAHWWNYEKTLKMGCYFQIGEEVKKNMTIEDAYRKSVETVVDWIANEVNMNKTYVLFRTYSPVHFRGGDWNNGGGCNSETLPDLGSMPVLSDIHFTTIFDVLSERMNKSKVTMNLDLLNITQMSLRRKDGHPSIYYLGPDGTASMLRQDCSHWCLPGVPDSWNEILYALLLKKDPHHETNATKVS